MSPTVPGAAPRRVVVLRHGETDHNAARIWQGHLDTRLSERGQQQADAVGPAIAALSPDRIVSSDLTRARLTAESVGRACGIPVELDARLREIDVGAWQGLTASEVADRWPEVQDALARGEDVRRGDHGETVAEVSERVAAALTEHLAHLGPRAVPRRVHPRCVGSHRRCLAARARARAGLAGARRPGQLPLGRARRGARGVADPDVERVLRGAVAGRVASTLRPIWGAGGAWVDSPSPLRGTPTRGCSAVGSAPPWHGGGQGFESPQLHKHRTGRRQPARPAFVGSRGFGRSAATAPLSSTGYEGPDDLVRPFVVAWVRRGRSPRRGRTRSRRR